MKQEHFLDHLGQIFKCSYEYFKFNCSANWYFCLTNGKFSFYVTLQCDKKSVSRLHWLILSEFENNIAER